MKRLILPAALAFALTGSFAFAQQAPAPIERPDATQAQPPDAPQQDAQQQDAQQPMHRHHHAPNANRETARLTRQLNLTPDQAQKIEPILANRDQKAAALAADTSLAPQDKHAQMKALHHNSEEQLASILTPDQLQQMKSMRHRGHHGDPESAPDPNAAPPSAS